MEQQPLTREAVLAGAKEQFGTEPEYLWSSDPGVAVLRRPDNRKWYALLMEVPRTRLGLPGDGAVWVMNVKCDPLLTGALRSRAGFLPAYHMNKERWISILLEGEVSLAEGLQLLALSYTLAGPQPKARRRRRISEVWRSEAGGCGEKIT